MFDLFDDPGACPACGAPHSACVGDRDSAGIGTTRGVIVIQQLPTRGDVPPPAADGDESTAIGAPAPAPERKRGARPLRRPMGPAGKT